MWVRPQMSISSSRGLRAIAAVPVGVEAVTVGLLHESHHDTGQKCVGLGCEFAPNGMVRANLPRPPSRTSKNVSTAMEDATRGTRFKLVPEMEVRVARWYARQRGTESQIEAWRKQASQLTDVLPSGSKVLEVAPGPGYLALEIARLGRFEVSGLDVSRTFVEIASAHARENGVDVAFRQGDVARMPF